MNCMTVIYHIRLQSHIINSFSALPSSQDNSCSTNIVSYEVVKFITVDGASIRCSGGVFTRGCWGTCPTYYIPYSWKPGVASDCQSCYSVDGESVQFHLTCDDVGVCGLRIKSNMPKAGSCECLPNCPP